MAKLFENIIVSAICSLLIWWLWNWILVPITGFAIINLIQSACLLALFGAFVWPSNLK